MSHPKTIGCLMLIVFCLIAPGSQSQQKPANENQMVLLHVRVTDPTDRAVLDVPESSFQVTEDGIPQKISLFINKEIPLSYGLAIDSSGSLHSQFEQIVRAAKLIVESNRPNDEAFLIRFISSDKIEVVQETTSDKAKLLDGLESLYIEGGASAVIDAAYLAAEKAAITKAGESDLRRRIVILVTDGEDRASYYNQKVLFNLLSEVDVQIFTIALTKEVKSDRDKATKLLMKFAAETGGRTYFPASKTDLERIAKEIINDIRMQYVIGYVPSGGDAKRDLRKVQVSLVENANQEKRAAITRVGYRIRK